MPRRADVSECWAAAWRNDASGSEHLAELADRGRGLQLTDPANGLEAMDDRRISGLHRLRVFIDASRVAAFSSAERTASDCTWRR